MNNGSSKPIFLLFSLAGAIVLSFAASSLHAGEPSEASQEPFPQVLDAGVFNDTLYEYIERPLYRTPPGVYVFPFELVATRGGDESRSPYMQEEHWFYNDAPSFKTWRVRLECSFLEYCYFYRFKELIARATPEEIDECVEKLGRLLPDQQALVLIAVFIYERIRRPYYGPEEVVKKDKDFWKRDLPLYFVETLPDYAPDESISEEQWEKWNAAIRKFAGNPATAFYRAYDERFIATDRDFLIQAADASKKDDNSPGYELKKQWTANIVECLSLLERLVGEVPSIEEFTSAESFQKYESCRTLLNALDKKIAESEGNERDLATALREYWLSFSCGLTGLEGEAANRACVGSSSLLVRSLDVVARQLLYARLEYRKELAEQGRIWSEDVESVAEEEDVAEYGDYEPELDSDSLPIVFDERFATESLFDYIRREAPNMKIFPFELVATRNTTMIRDVPFYAALYGYYGGIKARSKLSARIWRERYESTFANYLPFYRFKVKVSRSTASEIEECVNRIDECAPKEQALVLTSVYLFERIKRPYPGPQEMVSSKISFDQSATRSFYELLPCYAPDPSISEEQWERWTGVLYRFTGSSKTAFPGFRPDQRYLRLSWPRTNQRIPDGDFPKQEQFEQSDLVAVWASNIENCLVLLQKLVGEVPTKEEFAGKDCLAYDKSCQKLLPALDKIAQERDGNERDLALALREYWLSLDQGRPYPQNSSNNDPIIIGGNSSAMPKKLGVVARQLVYARFTYDKRQIEKGLEALKRGGDWYDRWEERGWNGWERRKGIRPNFTQYYEEIQ